ncbi:uncharacterized protein LOC132393824 [Hypanus sabinus]|uniref:uncharacterized protein LOC132393824 n=1 Tax=Hypanus sabinus TaxID=79690 RepID=UPI0028C3E843|nr:uncharacterized protein LOC132393824 [Hypanus sabinus]
MEVGAILWLLTVSSSIGAEKFVVIQDKSSIVATEGETVVIPCRHNVTNRVWSNHWVKGARNGTEVTNERAEYRDRILKPQGGDPSTNSTDVSLRLKYGRPSDSGMYFCKLKGMEWEMYGAGTYLTVRGKSRSFMVTQGQSSIFVAEGETVFMVCSHNANHSGDTRLYSWYRNTSEVSNRTAEYAGRVLGPDQQNSFKASIKLVDVRESDSGMYYCKIRIDGIGEAIGEGVRLIVSHTRKLKPVTILLVILLAAFGIGGTILLVSILFRRKTCKVENSVLVQRQGLSTLNDSTTAADLTSPQLDEGPGTAQDGNAPPCPEFQPEVESIYAPMQNLKTLSISMDNGMDVSTHCRPNNSLIPDGEVPAVQSIHYAVIYPSYSKNQAPAKTSVEDGDLEKDYGYDELNVTAKRSLQAEGDTNQEDGTVNQ